MESGAAQSQDPAGYYAVSVPPSLIPQAPSRTFSRQQSNLRASPVRSTTADQGMAPADAYSPGVRQSFRISQNSVSPVQPGSPGSIAGQQLGSKQTVPAIPHYMPPQPTYVETKQAATQSMNDTVATSARAPASTSDSNTNAFEKPSR